MGKIKEISFLLFFFPSFFSYSVRLQEEGGGTQQCIHKEKQYKVKRKVDFPLDVV